MTIMMMRKVVEDEHASHLFGCQVLLVLVRQREGRLRVLFSSYQESLRVWIGEIRVFIYQEKRGGHEFTWIADMRLISPSRPSGTTYSTIFSKSRVAKLTYSASDELVVTLLSSEASQRESRKYKMFIRAFIVPCFVAVQQSESSQLLYYASP